MGALAVGVVDEHIEHGDIAKLRLELLGAFVRQRLVEHVHKALHRPWSERSVAEHRHRDAVQTERRVDDVRGNLAQVQRSARKVPERSLTSNRLVHGAQWLGGDRGVRRVQLEQEDPVASVHDLGDAFDRRLGKHFGDLGIARCGAVCRARGHRRLEAFAKRRSSRSLIVTGGQRETRYRVEMGPPPPPRTILAPRRVVSHTGPRGAERAVSSPGGPSRW